MSCTRCCVRISGYFSICGCLVMREVANCPARRIEREGLMRYYSQRYAMRAPVTRATQPRRVSLHNCHQDGSFRVGVVLTGPAGVPVMRSS
jgi:hypothetical protein